MRSSTQFLFSSSSVEYLSYIWSWRKDKSCASPPNSFAAFCWSAVRVLPLQLGFPRFAQRCPGQCQLMIYASLRNTVVEYLMEILNWLLHCTVGFLAQTGALYIMLCHFWSDGQQPSATVTPGCNNIIKSIQGNSLKHQTNAKMINRQSVPMFLDILV